MRNQVGGPNRKPRRGGPAGFLARRMGLWSSPPSQYCNNDPAISFQKFQGGTQRDTRQRPALRCRSRIPSAVDSSGRRVSTCRFAIDPFSQGDSG